MSHVDAWRVILDPASSVTDPGYHEHHELIYILNGAYHGHCDGKRFILTAAEGAIYPAGVRHGSSDQRLGAITQLVLAWRGGPPLTGMLRFADPLGRVDTPFHRLLSLHGGDAATAAMRRRLAEVIIQEALWLGCGAPATAADPIERVRLQIEECYRSPLTLDHLCTWSRLSASSLCRHFAAQVGCSPMRYLRGVRFRRARELMVRADLAAETIAERVGLRDRVALSRLIKDHTGLGLRAYRRQLLAGPTADRASHSLR